MQSGSLPPSAPSWPLRLVAIALLVCVVTQAMYVGLEASGTPLAVMLWQTEAVAYLLIGLFGLAIIAARPVLGAGLATGGIVNLIQAGMGLTMFEPLTSAGEPLAPAFAAVLAMAFFLYFAGKAAFGLSAIVLGLVLLRSAPASARVLGGAAALAGLLALAVNLLAMMIGMSLAFAAGATGTVAMAVLALALLLAGGRASESLQLRVGQR